MATILCLGIAVLDYVFAVDSMPERPEKYRSDRLAVVGGGLAANAAVAVARLGGRARLATRLGADVTGDAIVADLKAEGVDCTLARRHPRRQSPVSSVFVDRAGERMVMSFADPDMPTDTRWLAASVLDGVDAVHGDNRWEEGAAILFGLANARGLPSLLDCDRAPKDSSLLALPTHIAFSELGLQEVSGEADPEAGLRRLAAGGLRNRLSVTLGERGVLWLDGEAARLSPAFRVDAVDTLAAGDVWHGAFALALGEGQPEREAMRFASAAAAIKCTRFGGRAGTPTRAEVEAFLKERS
jgi:sulfofructose kinase